MTQPRAQEFAQKPHLIIICGHYEGVDERVREALVDEEVSIGDYVLTNGALAAAVLVDAVVRLVAGRARRRSRARATIPLPAVCWKDRSTRGRRSSAGCGCRRCLLSGDHGGSCRVARRTGA